MSVTLESFAKKQNQENFNKLKIFNTLISFLKLWYINSSRFLYIIGAT